MSTKKTTSKKTKSKASNKQQTSHYQVTYLILGIFISFFSIIGLFNWGFIGLLMANSIRLFVGEAYVLVLVSFLYLGFKMIFSGKIISINLVKFIGFVLILASISTILHFQSFHTPGVINTDVIQETLATFRNELLTSQNKVSLGGGLLGSVLYMGFNYLFGFWGAHIFLVLIFFIGLFMLVGINIHAFQQAMKDLWAYFVQFLRSIKNSFKKATEVFEKDKTFKDNSDGSSELVEVVDESEDPLPEVKKRTNIFNRLMDSFIGSNENLSNNNPESNLEYQPIKLDKEKSLEEPFDATSPQATTASIMRATYLDGKTLDLDYFDQANETFDDEHSYESDEVVVQQQKNDTPEVELEMDTIEIESIQNRPKNENINQSSKPSEEVINSASRWQDKANHSLALTADALDEALSTSEDSVSAKEKAHKKKKDSKNYKLPTKALLNKIPPVDQSEEYARINKNIDKLEKTFESFGVNAKIVKANLGPSVTKYEVQPAIGVKVSKIVSLSDDIALALAARDIRMEAPIPGKSLIGIEVPNTQVSPVSFWEIIDAALDSPNLLEVPLGRDISGTVCLADLSKMPHLLIAGATGSGKSVGMNVIIVSLLMKAKPEEVKFLMIDPKKVELTMYDDIPHLLAPVVTNPRKAAQALNKIVQEMERRYELFAASGVRNIDSYNENLDHWNAEEGHNLEPLPKIVVFIDELADLMMVASNDVENAIIRLAQMARAAGIHMIIATQRPSVDVITGIIKANVPSRLAFAVSSGTDSRTILDSVGAEKLLGRGDMLFQPMGRNKPIRVQGAYISDREVERITEYIKEQQDVNYDENIVITEENDMDMEVSDDEYYPEAVEMLYGLETISISQLQRRFRIGYNRAARLVDDLEAQGLVSEQDGSKPRQVLVGQMNIEE
ncbi:DNA translocase FtsK [Fundicoccus sp. Sow4_H7]|uniref:FtsK/SpoIIIE family DNA translocase n=1 Tax=Fundicoccus sp. Sow4_H7 TaxID=3438784 RepID=UPI003F91BB7E